MMHEKHNQLPMLPIYHDVESGISYLTFQEAAIACGKLTLIEEDSGYWTDNILYKSTIFKEVKAITLKMTDQIEALLDKSPVIDVDPSTAEKAVLALREALIRQWDPEKIHVMATSSGYDTRLLLAIIKQEQEARGEDWFGETYFYCVQPEIPEWRKVMDYFGWPEVVLRPIGEYAEPLDFFAPTMTFDAIGKANAGINRYRKAISIAELQLESFITVDENIQRVSATWSDETSVWIGKKTETTREFIHRKLFDNPSPWYSKGTEFIYPFASFEYVSLLLKQQPPLFGNAFKLAKLKVVDPILTDLERFPNGKFRLVKELKEKGFLSYRELSAETISKMEQQFKDSWYYQTMNPKNVLPFKMEVTLAMNHEVREYIKAAICEHLIERGCEIS